MTEYFKSPEDGKLSGTSNSDADEVVFSIISVEEFREDKDRFYHHKELLHSLSSIRYCKAEAFRECVIGTVRIPKKKEEEHPQISFGFYMSGEEVVFIEDSGNLKKWMDRQLDKIDNIQTADQALLQVIDQFVENDTLYLSHMEKEMEELEDTLLNDIPEDFFETLTMYRQKLSELNSFYEQLAEIGDEMQSHDCLNLVANVQPWDRFTQHIERLHNHVHLLRENVLQLRELYQSRQDERQNKIMCILTVVTTLFLPLTLLTGWYGMNFNYMPELQWKYGYLAVIGIAVTIVTVEIIYFKKKKLL